MQTYPLTRRSTLRRTGLLLGSARALVGIRSVSHGVIRALRKQDLEVVAVHQHMLEEQLRIIFLHYYGNGAAATLAEGFPAALGQLGGKGTQAGA